ncbi:MAG: hypothetical protein FWD67_12455 [Betaproteobacteria bacterium]|nr:hypothetical protein [Betaproteobacteria bacterium]
MSKFDITNNGYSRLRSSLKYLEQYVRKIVTGVETMANRTLGREFIDALPSVMAIEVTGACNLKCRFCAYEKKELPKVSMPSATFESSVEQSIALGYSDFQLTPCAGDVFMDKYLFDKLEYLDRHADVDHYHFFSNLSVPQEEQILRLLTLKKLSTLTVSIYGHDEASFIAITKSTAKVYQRLIANLRILLAHKLLPFKLEFGFRSTASIPANAAGELMEILKEFARRGDRINSSHGVFNNWGGMISDDDVKGLDVKIIPGDVKYRSGPCAKLFDSPQITATGLVNACSCRDVNAVLRIGDILKTPLVDILSPGNQEYRRVIQDQLEGRFQSVCNGCDFYRSIYHQPKFYRKNRIKTQSIDEFMQMLDVRCAAARSGFNGKKAAKETPITSVAD